MQKNCVQEKKLSSSKCPSDKMLSTLCPTKVANCFLSWCSKRTFKTDFYFRIVCQPRNSKWKKSCHGSCRPKMSVQKIFSCRVWKVGIKSRPKISRPPQNVCPTKKCLPKTVPRKKAWKKVSEVLWKKFCQPLKNADYQLPATGRAWRWAGISAPSAGTNVKLKN